MTKSKPKIWSSNFLATTYMLRKTNIKLNIDEPTSRDFVDIRLRYESGSPIAPKDVPIYPVALYFKYPDTPESYKKKWRDIFQVQLGLVVVSGRMKDQLQEFNLCETSFRELPLFENDQNTPRPEGPFFLMHILQFQDAFVPELSENVEKLKNVDKWRPAITSDVLAVNPDAVGDADLWMDHRIENRVFFSDRLRQAIKDAKFRTYGLSFKACKVVANP